MPNDYFNPSSIGQHTKTNSSAINALFTLVETGFALLPGIRLLQENRVAFYETTGAADVYVVSMTTALTSYVDGLSLRLKINATNTGACTINVDSNGARSVKLMNAANPAAGDLTDGDFIDVVYDADNSQFKVMSQVRGQIT